jgi:hypothetical protein
MQLRFVPSESTNSYFEALHGYLRNHGCPVAFYSDILDYGRCTSFAILVNVPADLVEHRN